MKLTNKKKLIGFFELDCELNLMVIFENWSLEIMIELYEMLMTLLTKF